MIDFDTDLPNMAVVKMIYKLESTEEQKLSDKEAEKLIKKFADKLKYPPELIRLIMKLISDDTRRQRGLADEQTYELLFQLLEDITGEY